MSATGRAAARREHALHGAPPHARKPGVVSVARSTTRPCTGIGLASLAVALIFGFPAHPPPPG